jgi:hypothetical protein
VGQCFILSLFALAVHSVFCIEIFEIAPKQIVGKSDYPDVPRERRDKGDTDQYRDVSQSHRPVPCEAPDTIYALSGHNTRITPTRLGRNGRAGGIDSAPDPSGNKHVDWYETEELRMGDELRVRLISSDTPDPPLRYGTVPWGNPDWVKINQK